MKGFLTLLAALVIPLFMALGTRPAEGMSQEQRRLFNSGVLFYDIDELASGCVYLGSGGAGGVLVPTNFNLGADPEMRPVNLMSTLMSDYGLTAEQAAGIVGNFMHESGGSDLPPNYNEVLGIDGDGAGPPRRVIPGTNTGGYGWAQWTGGRKINFIEFAIDNGYMESWNVDGTDAANYAFLKHELNGIQSYTIDEITKKDSVREAAISFEKTFERAGKPVMNRRIELAELVYERFVSSGQAAGFTSGSCAGQGGAAILGEYAFPLIVNKSGIHNNGMFSGGTSNIGGHPYTAYDILVDPGTPVAAFMSGTVFHVGSDRCPGRLVGIYNEENDMTISYLHLDFDNHAEVGDTVAVGERIGEVGSAAAGCGIPHLHIDAASGNRRPGCSRLNCPIANQQRFIDIGVELYDTYQLLEE